MLSAFILSDYRVSVLQDDAEVTVHGPDPCQQAGRGLARERLQLLRRSALTLFQKVYEAVRPGAVYGKVNVGVGLADIEWALSRVPSIVNCLANSSETNSVVNVAENYVE